MPKYYDSCGWLPFGWGAHEASIDDICDTASAVSTPTSSDVIACCRAETAECLACAHNMSVLEFCSLDENKKIAGCSTIIPSPAVDCSEAVCTQDICSSDGKGRRQIGDDCCACPQ